MNKNTKLLISAVITAAALSACSSSSKGKPAAKPAPAPQQAAQQNQPFTPQTVKVDAIDSTKEVHYRCGQNGQDPLSVMYGFKGNEPVVAQVKYKNELTPNLFRVVGSSDDINAFWGGNVAWVAGRANLGNIDKVDGNMLTVRGKTTVNGKEEVVDQIVAKYCSVANVPAKAGKPAPKKSAGKAKR